MKELVDIAYYALFTVVVAGGFTAWVYTLWEMTKR